jgi:uncharacterized protein (UPF0262 family)
MSEQTPAHSAPPAVANPRAKLTAITLDQASLHAGSHHIDHEREVAIFDIIDGNVFALDGRDDGPFTLALSIADEKLMFNVGTQTIPGAFVHGLSMTPFKRIIRDYFTVCDSYYEAIRSAPPAHIQAIDIERRRLHDEGSRVLVERLAGKITVDTDTSRRLFTLIAALHWRGSR